MGAGLGGLNACLTIWNSANADNPLGSQWLWMGPDLFFDQLQKVPGSLCHRRISRYTTILRIKISPSSQRFGHGQCQESYLLGLILGLIYKLPCKVYLDSCPFSFLARPPERLWDYHNAWSKRFCCSCCVSACKQTRTYIFQFVGADVDNKKQKFHISEWGQTQCTRIVKLRFLSSYKNKKYVTQ